MAVELYGNRVRIEPGMFGAHAELINALGGFLAEAVPDDQDFVVGHRSAVSITRGSSSVGRAPFRWRRGSSASCRELTGFEEEGAIGAIYLGLTGRWDLDRPF
jgi:hypothetical protein